MQTSSEYQLELEKEQKKIRQRSLIITGAVLLAIILLSLLVVLTRNTIPPMDENQYTVAGSVDFGDYSQGSADINNRQQPSPNPNPNQNQQQQTESPSSQEESALTSDQPSEVSRSESATDQTTQPSDQIDNPLTFDNWGGGSNDGNSNQFGDAGTPGAPLSDGNGLNWGDGEFGAKGRKLLNNYQRPVYDVNEEGYITFELEILPSGTVRNVRVINSQSRCLCPTMQRRAIAKLKKLRFSPVNDNRVQTLRVTHTFRQN